MPNDIVTSFIDELAVLRSGKAKKNDPPIPADLAPISGGGKRQSKKEVEEPSVFLDSIKFRYSTETIADQTQSAEEPEEAAQETKRSRNRRRKPKNKAEAPQEQEKPAKQEKKPAPKAEPAPKEEAAGEDKPKRAGNHRRNHRRRPRGNGAPKQGE